MRDKYIVHFFYRYFFISNLQSLPINLTAGMMSGEGQMCFHDFYWPIGKECS